MKFIDKYDNYITKPSSEPVRKKTSVYGLLIIGSYILLTQDIGVPFKEIPGGTVETDEPEHDALVRELKEETGFSIRVESTSPIAEHIEHFYNNDSNTYFESTRKVYRVSLETNTFNIREIFENEIASVGFYHIDTIKDIKLQDFIRKTIAKYSVTQRS